MLFFEEANTGNMIDYQPVGVKPHMLPKKVYLEKITT
jgi:hypothetical protein